MKMDRATKAAVLEVERCSKLGALKLQQDRSKKALEAYQQAYQSSLLLGHSGYMQRACAFNLAAVHISTGSYTDGLTYLKLAEPPHDCCDGKSNGDLYFNYGLAYEGLRNVAEVKFYYSKALKEYRSEKENAKMEAEVISRLGKVCVACGQYSEAETYMRQLIQAYERLGDTRKLLQSQAEQANLLLRLDQVEEAEKIADGCFKRSHDQELSNITVNILTELSLLYTQICKYNKALRCCQSALPVVSTQKTDGKQVAVLYQNLGVIHNYLRQYQDAIKYHLLAADKHAETNNRKSQGHCFINLGYAFSQLKDIDRAEEYFLHSLQAAKDCGDRKSEWQSLESLGAVACHKGDLKRSQGYYKLALTVLARSTDAVDLVVQDRIVEKLTTVIKLQVHKPDKQVDMPKQDEIQDGILAETHQRLLKKVRSRDGSVIAVRKGGKVKYLRVRRSGTLRKFNKVALGLDASMTPPPSQNASKQRNFSLDVDDEVFSASSFAVSDLEEDKEEEKFDRDIEESRQTEKMSESGKEMNGEKVYETDSEEDQMKQVMDAMQKVADKEDEGEVTADEHISEQAASDEDDTLSEDSTETDVSSSLDSTEDEPEGEDRHNGRDKLQVPPHIPTVPPSSSYLGQVRTYEVPAKSSVPSKIIDKNPQGDPSQDLMKAGNQGEEVIKSSTDDDGNNFFQSQERGLFNSRRDEDEVEENKDGGYDEDGPIYESIRVRQVTEGDVSSRNESIRHPSHEDHNVSEVDTSSGNESSSEKEDAVHEHLPKGERDKTEHEAFQADVQARQAKVENRQGVQKPSRACIVM